MIFEPQGNVSWSGSSEEDHHPEEDEEELFSRTILNTSHESEEETEEGSEENPEGQRRTEPTILPTSPRHQIHSVIIHLQEGQRSAL